MKPFEEGQSGQTMFHQESPERREHSNTKYSVEKGQPREENDYSFVTVVLSFSVVGIYVHFFQ